MQPGSLDRAHPLFVELNLAEVDVGVSIGQSGHDSGAEHPLAVKDGGTTHGDALALDVIERFKANLDAVTGARQGQGDVGVDELDSARAPVSHQAG